jgi:hypothetical protein
VGNIVWLASYPKSGNTWLRIFLANMVADRDEPVPLNELSRYCEDESLPELFSAAAGRPSTGLSLDEICALRPQVHAGIAARARGTVLVKTHNFAGAYDGHPLHNPAVTAGAIYVVRNPLDVVVSMSHHFGLSADEAIERLGSDRAATGNDDLFVSQVLGSWSMHVNSWVNSGIARLLVLRYEDLLERPAKNFARVARLLGVGDKRARIARAVRLAGFESAAGMELAGGFVEASPKSVRFFRAGTAGQWRAVLNRDQVTRIVTAHRAQMARFAYLPAGY